MIAIKATCMVCGKWKDCYRIHDIGWVCADCYNQDLTDREAALKAMKIKVRSDN